MEGLFFGILRYICPSLNNLNNSKKKTTTYIPYFELQENGKVPNLICANPLDTLSESQKSSPNAIKSVIFILLFCTIRFLKC